MEKIEVLDHGYALLVESWGSDERIIESARMSTGKGFLGWGPLSTDESCPGSYCVNGIIDGGEGCRSNGMTHHLCNGTGKVQKPGDEKLLRYLWEHKHATPFEMAGLTVEVQAPIFVFRQWHRHRTQCLAPDTLVHFEAPKSDRHGRRYVYKMRIEDVWKKWQPTTRKARPGRQTNALFPRQRIAGMRLRCFDEERGEVVHTRIVDVIRGEPKPMVRVTTASGRSIVATRDHRFFTNRGWQRLGDAIETGSTLVLEGVARGQSMRWERPPIREESEEWTAVVGWEGLYQVSSEGRVCRVMCEPKRATAGAHGYDVVSLSRNGKTTTATVHRLVLEAFHGYCPPGHEARHLNHNRADNRASNLAWGSSADNSADQVAADRQQRLVSTVEEIVSVEDVGELPTYDLSVEGPWHNFVADGFVVHNSYNEMSARYTPLPNLDYVPTVERLMAEASANKQAGTAAGAAILSEAAAQRFVEALRDSYEMGQSLYELALADGVPKEIARVHLPVARYSRMRASANLRNWLAFLTLRMDSHAQYEIRVYADAVGKMIANCFPRTWELFAEGLGR